MTVTKDIMITAQEYYEYSDGPPYHQLITGQLIMSPSPSAYHQRILKRLILSRPHSKSLSSGRFKVLRHGRTSLWLAGFGF